MGQTIHIGSISRFLAPGLRIGCLVLPVSLVPFLRQHKGKLEDLGDPALEWAVANLIRDGELARHLRKVRKIYLERRIFLVAGLRELTGDALEVDPPQGGMGLWIRVKPPLDVEAVIRAVRSLGLVLNSPSGFFLDKPKPAFWLGFAQAKEEELSQAIRRLEEAVGKVQRTGAKQDGQRWKGGASVQFDQ